MDWIIYQDDCDGLSYGSEVERRAALASATAMALSQLDGVQRTHQPRRAGSGLPGGDYCMKITVDLRISFPNLRELQIGAVHYSRSLPAARLAGLRSLRRLVLPAGVVLGGALLPKLAGGQGVAVG